MLLPVLHEILCSLNLVTILRGCRPGHLMKRIGKMVPGAELQLLADDLYIHVCGSKKDFCIFDPFGFCLIRQGPSCFFFKFFRKIIFGISDRFCQTVKGQFCGKMHINIIHALPDF